MLVPLFWSHPSHICSGVGRIFRFVYKWVDDRYSTDFSFWFFCMGAGINIKTTGIVLRKSGILVLTKIAVSWLVAFIASSFIPGNGIQTGFFAGFSALALVASMDMTNGGLYAMHRSCNSTERKKKQELLY
ncbi:MAG: 2-keto-3-deoxygluconate permease [Thermoactinomyces sp.]